MTSEGSLQAGDFFYWAESELAPDGQYRGVVHFTAWRDVDDVIETLDPPLVHLTGQTWRWPADAVEAAHALAAELAAGDALGIDR
ncbi:hypothetical protein PTE30175_01707 [Pandoraea terrae]|uniref:Uncharacterized protein n=1 Tax=Pandoraea terrae TaxID=1537710 RepID=A0A5E4U4V3_9BURK|nr:hypothetical protein [Pandoraea terrae]VVD94078.1 hypothetical protein PTE30175_01707 [Pandoraea terrae]